MADGGSGRVQVYARVRPLGGNEAASPCCVEADGDAGTVSVRDESSTVERVLRGEGVDAAVGSSEARQFTFDGVFHRGSTQRDVFSQVGVPVLRECMNGLNGTILAYGQTGSGKTFSLLNQAQAGECTGLLPRLVAGLFVQIARDRASVYQVEAAALQVYNEQVDDLLAHGHQSGAGHNLAVQSGGVVPDLTWLECTRPDQMLEAFSRARANLVYAETKMNKASSRSHAVFQMRITRCPRDGAASDSGAPKQVEGTRSLFSVVDLAGSERVKKSGAEGARFQEATAINKSLLALGNVVSALAAKKKHVPIRDSKLTRLLDGSLGGNCKTSLLVCVSPAAENQSETVNTLEFASRAMCVEVDAKVNAEVVQVSSQALMADLSSTMGDLGVPVGPELEELKRSSAEAVERAEQEARRQQQAAEAAVGERSRLRQAADAADQRAKSSETEAETLRRERQQAQDEADAHRRNAERLEGEVRRLEREAASAQGLAGDLENAHETKRQADLEVAQLRQRAQDLEGELTCQLQQQRSASCAAEERARVAEEELRRVTQERDRLLERASASEAGLAALREQVATLEAQLAEESQLSEARIAELQQKAADALRRCEALEAEQARAARQAEQHISQLRREAGTLQSSLSASQQEAAAKDDSHHEEMQRTIRAHTLEVVGLQGEWSTQRMILEKSLHEAHAHCTEAVAAAEERLKAQSARWAAERASLSASFDDRLEALQRAWEEERAALKAQVEEKCRELCEKEASWRESKEEEVRKAWESGSLQQRRLAAAFKASRCVLAAKEANLKEAHDDLASRFAARESRPEDKQELARKQNELLERERAIEEKNRMLQNRDENDRIFGAFGTAAKPSRPPSAVPLGGHRRSGSCSARRGSGTGRSSSERPRRPASAHHASRGQRSGSNSRSDQSIQFDTDR